jgi:hypothetical protein
MSLVSLSCSFGLQRRALLREPTTAVIPPDSTAVCRNADSQGTNSFACSKFLYFPQSLCSAKRLYFSELQNRVDDAVSLSFMIFYHPEQMGLRPQAQRRFSPQSVHVLGKPILKSRHWTWGAVPIRRIILHSNRNRLLPVPVLHSIRGERGTLHLCQTSRQLYRVAGQCTTLPIVVIIVQLESNFYLILISVELCMALQVPEVCLVNSKSLYLVAGFGSLT